MGGSIFLLVMKFNVHGNISRAKLLDMRVGQYTADPPMMRWEQGTDAQKRTLDAWKAKGDYHGLLLAKDMNAEKASKGYMIRRIYEYVKELSLSPPPTHCIYEMSYDLDDIPPDRPDIRDYLTPANFHADVEVYFNELNTIRSLEDWKLREPYYLAYVKRYMLHVGILQKGDELEVVILDSSNHKKISRHYIWKFNGMFYSVRDCGAFARNLEAYILADKSCGSPQNPNNMWYIWDEKGECRTFLFDSIYTKHRCFRMYGSTKMGQERYLKLLGVPDKYPTINLRLLKQCSIFIPREAEGLSDQIPLIRVLEPDGITHAMSSSVRPRYGQNGEMVGRSCKSRAIVDGIRNASSRANSTVSGLIRHDVYVHLSKLKWKGKESLLTVDSDAGCGGLKPAFAKPMAEKLVEWFLQQTLRDVYGEYMDGGSSSSEPPAAKKPRTNSINDRPIHELCGKGVKVYKTKFAIDREVIYVQLAEPNRFCPVMHLDGRRSTPGDRNDKPNPYPTLIHKSNNTGLSISLKKRQWWWNCHQLNCHKSIRDNDRRERPIPDEVWNEFSKDIEQLQRELRETFSRDIGKELLNVQRKLQSVKLVLPEPVVVDAAE